MMLPLSINWLKVAMIAAGISAAFYGYHLVKQRGAEEITLKIERENSNATKNASEATSALYRCIDSGGMYDFQSGYCTRGPISRRRDSPRYYGKDITGSEQN